MYSLAYRSLVQSPSSPENLVTAISRLEETCIRLTKGQYLDMAFETESQVTAEMYWNMVGGKTAALLACSAVIGAIVTGVDTKTIDALQVFAWNLDWHFKLRMIGWEFGVMPR
jgi:geranylgeranyl diphosphate synthase type I